MDFEDRPESQQEWSRRWGAAAFTSLFTATQWFEDQEEGEKLFDLLGSLSDSAKEEIRETLSSLFEEAYRERIRVFLGAV